MNPKRHRSSLVLFSFAGVLVTVGCGDEATPTTTADTVNDVAAGGNDVGPDIAEVPPEGPQARIFPVDPLSSPATRLVGLPNLAEPPAELVGPFARVRSCTPDTARGTPNRYEFGGGGSIDTISCVPEHNATAVDGHYLHINPPASRAEDDGAFAEVMMYHHMSIIHRYFSEFYGITDRDESLDAVTNIQTWTSNCNDWSHWTNAAYVPREALDYVMLGLDLSETYGDAIVFSGTPERNFAFDTTVIYHEYTHAILGATRLSGTFLDDQGFNNLPGALNEAYADYFAGTLTGQAAVGVFALNDIAAADFCGGTVDDEPLENYARDMRAERRCPDDLVSQVHSDSEIFSVALWEMRTELGPLKADTIALQAVLQLTNESDFGMAATATIEAARDIYGEQDAELVRGFFEDRNLVSCERVISAGAVGGRDIPFRHEGTRVFEVNPFPGYTPGYVQYGVDVPANTKRVVVQLDAVSGRGDAIVLDIEGAFKFGGAVRYTLGREAGQAVHDASIVVFNSGNTLVLQNANGGTLAEGSWALALHNRARRTFRLRAMAVTFE